MWIFIGIGAFIIVLSIIFRVAAAFRLTIPLLYGLLAPTLFSKWFYANYELANFIGYALLALVGLSWVISLIRKIREFTVNRREERFSEDLLRQRIRTATKRDENGYLMVDTDDLFRE
jgi:putative Mn2+ efflux pump MntP